MIIIDYSAIGIAAVISHISSTKTVVDEGYCKHLVLGSIRSITQNFSPHFGEVHVCIDSRSWRKDYFPQYKACRKKDGKSKIDWENIYKALNDVECALVDCFPVQVHRFYGAEADDIMAVLIRNNKSTEDICVVTEDKDLYQFIRQEYERVVVVHPRRKKIIFSEYAPREIKDFLETKSKRYELLEKPANYGKDYLLEQIMRGDVSDGIPNVLSDIDTFVCKEKRQTPMLAKKLADLMLGKMTPDVMKRFEQNRKLISMTVEHPECPKIDIVGKDLSTVDIITVSQYLLNNGLMDLYSKASEFFVNSKSQEIKLSGIQAWL